MPNYCLNMKKKVLSGLVNVVLNFAGVTEKVAFSAWADSICVVWAFKKMNNAKLQVYG